MGAAFAAVLGIALAWVAYSLLAEPALQPVLQPPRLHAQLWRIERDVAVRLAAFSVGDVREALDLCQIDPANFTFLRVGMMVGGASAGLLWRRPLLALALLVAAWVGPAWVVKRRLRAWRAALQVDLPAAVEVLDLYFAAGSTVPDALEGAACFVTGPLQAELRRVRARAALGQDGPGALAAFACRAASAEVRTLACTLAGIWRVYAPGQDVFAAFGRSLGHLKEVQIKTRTRLLPVYYTLLVGCLLLGLVVLTGVPAGFALVRSLSVH